MKKTLVLLIAVLVVVSLLPGCKKPAAPPTTTTAPPPATTGAPNAVTIKDFAFSPATIEVKAGTTVTWTNTDAVPHEVFSDTAGAFDSGLIAPDKSYSFTFATAGTFAYHCAIHPYMKATVKVD